ncbi:MAG: IPT/TIG domain-containing protein [Terriglobales bacterium]|jgi:hypothetical protein
MKLKIAVTVFAIILTSLRGFAQTQPEAASGGLSAPWRGQVRVSPMAAAKDYMGVQVNGNCLSGTHCPATPLPYNTATTLPVSYKLTLANKDKYLLNGAFWCSNNGDGGYLPCTLSFQLTYEGNPDHGNSQEDAITVDWYNASDTEYSYGNFSFELDGAFSDNIANSSSASGSFDGNGVVGPYMPPGSFDSGTFEYSEDASGGVFSFSTDYTLTFGVNSPPGSYIVIGQTSPLPLPDITSFSPPSGAAGTTNVTINGGGFTGTTEVTFNKVAATDFVVISESQISATVPCGAKSGPIEVEAPGGPAKSKTKFTVTAPCGK